jgi:hypothetical protein
MDVIVENATDVDVMLQLKCGCVWKDSRFWVPSGGTKRCCLERLGSNSRIAVRDAAGPANTIYAFIERHQLLYKAFIKLIRSPGANDSKILVLSES